MTRVLWSGVLAGLAVVAWLLPTPTPPAPQLEPGISNKPATICLVEESGGRSSRLGFSAPPGSSISSAVFTGGSIAEGSLEQADDSGSLIVDAGSIGAVGTSGVLSGFEDSRFGASVVTVGASTLAASECSIDAPSIVMVAGGSTLEGFGYEILIANPFAAEAVVSIGVVSEAGSESSSALQAVVVPANSLSRLDLATLLPGRDWLNVTVESVRGSAVVWERASANEDLAVAGSVEPAVSWFAVFGPTGPERHLVVAAPQGVETAYQIDIYGPNGLEEAAISGVVEAGSQVEVDIDAWGDGLLGARVVTSAPVVAFVRSIAEGSISLTAALPTPSTSWLLGGVGTLPDFSASLLVLNPSLEDANITVESSSGSQSLLVSADGVVEVSVPPAWSGGIKIESDEPVVVFWAGRSGTSMAMNRAVPIFND